jgi:hypothetical protein
VICMTFGDDSGRYGGASSISPSFKALSPRGRSREVVTPDDIEPGCYSGLVLSNKIFSPKVIDTGA